MVLRRPYAFLIKHFKLIHLIVTAILGILVSKNRAVYIYIRKCIADSVNKYDALSYIDYGIYLWIFLAIILLFAIFWLLKYKNKPKNIYIFAIAIYIIIGIFMFVVFGFLSTLPNEVINQKSIRLYRDILLITLVIQYIFIIIMLIRGLGFDIKKFNFNKDLEELDIKEEDADEVEVNIGVNTTNVVRAVRKQKREFGYFFKEFKLYIIIILAIVGIFLIMKGYNYYSDKLKVYKENDIVGSINYIKVVDSYYTTVDGKNYVIIKFDASRYGKRDRLNSGNMVLQIGRKKYIPNKNICYNFSEIGICYKKQLLRNEAKTYILTYNIDETKVKKSYLLYTESYDNAYKIKLDLEKY